MVETGRATELPVQTLRARRRCPIVFIAFVFAVFAERHTLSCPVREHVVGFVQGGGNGASKAIALRRGIHAQTILGFADRENDIEHAVFGIVIHTFDGFG